MRIFDSVKYDNESASLQEWYKEKCDMIEKNINCNLQTDQEKALALRKLKEMYIFLLATIRLRELGFLVPTIKEEMFL